MIIYKITNKITNKVYIGQTSIKLEARWKKHIYSALRNEDKYIFHKAIRKYGAACFTLEIIDYAATKDELNEKEIYWIAYYNSKTPNGYNMTNGGDGVVGCYRGEQYRQKMSNALKNHIVSDETREKISKSKKGTKPWNYGLRTNPSKEKKDIKRRVSKIDKNTKEELFVYNSIREASQLNNIHQNRIIDCCRGRRKTAAGYCWAYTDLRR